MEEPRSKAEPDPGEPEERDLSVKKAKLTTDAGLTDSQEEKLCRYCFEGEEEGELISPCNCSGGQKYVHLRCLRQWQRLSLASQPTHPAFYTRDIRHEKCNVCLAQFTCPPPTRHELMASFTGPEIAALIRERCIIAATEEWSESLRQQLQMDPRVGVTGCRHWLDSVLLITNVVEEQRDEDTGITDCGEDHVCAVNLCRQIDAPAAPNRVGTAISRVCSKPGYKGVTRVEIEHYLGGPCSPSSLACCIVPGGTGCGWTVIARLEQALETAHSRAVKRCEQQGHIHGGQTVKLQGLKSVPELNDELGIALVFNEENGRWLVRLRNGDGKQLKPDNLEGLDGAHGRVLCFWGDARWTRTQLLGEIARGSWGLCRANIGDLAAPVEVRWAGTHGRLAIAPKNAMTEDYMEAARREMNQVNAMMDMQLPEEREALEFGGDDA